MRVPCMLGFYSWEFCPCKWCGSTRDVGHALNEDCGKCTRFGAERIEREFVL